MNKLFWLDIAEVLDALRVAPRLIVGVYLGLLVWVTIHFSTHYFALPMLERTVSFTAFVSVVMTAAYGAFPFIVKIYMDGGRAWGPQGPGSATPP